MRRILLAVLVAGCSARMGWAAETSASFLKIGVGARPIGMGSAFTGVADDINALAWNPAGLSLLTRREMGAMHAELFADTRYDFLGYAQPLIGAGGENYGTVALGVQYLTQGAIEGRDANRQATGSFTGSDMALSLGYSRALGSALRLGANVKYIRSDIETASASALALDAGAMLRTPIAGLTLGAAAQNLGPGMKYLDQSNPLPLSLSAGAGYQLGSGLLLALDVKTLPREQRTSVSVGTEYAAFSALSLRAGYLAALGAGSAAGSAAAGRQFAAMSGLGAGLGVKMSGYRLDYSFTPLGELGSVQRISLGARF